MPVWAWSIAALSPGNQTGERERKASSDYTAELPYKCYLNQKGVIDLKQKEKPKVLWTFYPKV